jgi:acetyl esterase
MLQTTFDPLASLDPDIAEFVRRSIAASSKFPPRESMTPAQARDVAEQTRRQWTEGGPQMASTEDLTVPTAHGDLRIRIYRPKDQTGEGAFIYLPGGGWTLFSINTHDRLMREYADGAGLIVIGVDYSRAPEAKFPQPVEEIDDIFDWLLAHAAEIGFAPDRLILGGDSAGGNITAATCIRRRDAGKLLPAGVVYNYGAFDLSFTKPSVVKFGSGAYILSTHMMLWFLMNYMRSPEDLKSPLLRPLLAPLAGLPPAFMAITEFDVLYDENMEMAEALRAAGVDVTANVYRGTVHSFLEAMSIAEVARRAIADTCGWLRARVG